VRVCVCVYVCVCVCVFDTVVQCWWRWHKEKGNLGSLGRITLILDD